jgi:hypothetical protein
MVPPVQSTPRRWRVGLFSVQEPTNKKTRQPTSGGGLTFHHGDILFTPALTETTSSKTLVLEKAPLRLQRSVAVPHFGTAPDDAAFMIYISPDSKSSSLATTVSPFVQMPLLANNCAS